MDVKNLKERGLLGDWDIRHRIERWMLENHERNSPLLKSVNRGRGGILFT